MVWRRSWLTPPTEFAAEIVMLGQALALLANARAEKVVGKGTRLNAEGVTLGLHTGSLSAIRLCP